MFKSRVALNAPDIGRNKNARNIVSFEFGVGFEVRAIDFGLSNLIPWRPGRVLNYKAVHLAKGYFLM